MKIIRLRVFQCCGLSSSPAERDSLADGPLGAVFKFVHEARLPAALVLLHSGAHPQEQQQVLRELTQRTQFLTQQKHHLKVKRTLDHYHEKKSWYRLGKGQIWVKTFVLASWWR